MIASSASSKRISFASPPLKVSFTVKLRAARLTPRISPTMVCAPPSGEGAGFGSPPVAADTVASRSPARHINADRPRIQAPFDPIRKTEGARPVGVAPPDWNSCFEEVLSLLGRRLLGVDDFLSDLRAVLLGVPDLDLVTGLQLIQRGLLALDLDLGRLRQREGHLLVLPLHGEGLGGRVDADDLGGHMLGRRAAPRLLLRRHCERHHGAREKNRNSQNYVLPHSESPPSAVDFHKLPPET